MDDAEDFELPEPDELEREDLADWQRMVADTRTVDELIDAALTAGDIEHTDAYIEALNVLQLRGSHEVLVAARGLCAGASPVERRLGATILSRLGNNVWMLRVARGLRMSGSEMLRAKGEELLKKLGPDLAGARTFPKEALATLLPMLETETDIETLRDIISAVGEYQHYHPSITEKIAEFRTHPSRDVRFTVATRLFLNIESPVARTALAGLTHDVDAGIRHWAKECMQMARLVEREEAERGMEDELPE